MTRPVWPVLLICTLASGCAESLDSHARRDLTRIEGNDVVLVGNIRIYVYGYDQTGRSAIEAGGAGRYQLSDSGDVLWLVRRGPGAPVQLTWLYTPDSSYGPSVLQLAPGNVTQRCVYFGDVTIRIDPRHVDEVRNDWDFLSAPPVRVDVRDAALGTVSRVTRLNPTVAKLGCRAPLGSSFGSSSE